MRHLIIVSIMVSWYVVGHCAGAPPVTKHEAMKIATRELQKRELPLPKDRVVLVKPSMIYSEISQDKAIYLVAFRTRAKGLSGLLYDVHVNQRSGKVEDVIDIRHAVPAEMYRKRGGQEDR